MRPIVAVSADFFTSVFKLPRTQQDKAIKFVEQFRNDPTSSGINYEVIQVARDKKLRSVRIDQAYRAIVLAPHKGNVYVLLWVDKHDDAYAWARNKIFQINPESGALQFMDSEIVDEANSVNSSLNKNNVMLFDGVRDRHLMRLGVPEELIPLVREVEFPLEVDDLQSKLPSDAYESLCLLADGESLEEVLSAYGIIFNDETVNIDDFEKALEHPQTKRSFILVSDDDAMRNMFNAPLARWRVFLHPVQQKLICRNWNGAVRVLGGAGTGKTVVAMHRAKWIAESLLKKSGKKVLFTTYTKNLAFDIEQNLKSICSAEVMAKIEVVDLGAWVIRLFKQQGQSINFLFSIQRKKDLWRKAFKLKVKNLEYPASFYYEEWDKVIQPQNIESLESYLKVRRIGRGVRLDHTMREAVWPVFERYRFELRKSGLKEREDVYRDAADMILSADIQLPYHSVIVDESQDFGLNAFKLMRAIVPEGSNDLFVVGDSHQRIYGSKVVLSNCGIKIVGRSHKLRVNYRTTEQIRRFGVSVLGDFKFDDLDNGQDDHKGYRSLMSGGEPLVRCFDSFDEELKFLVDELEALTKEDLNKSCIALRTPSDIDRYCLALNKASVSYHKVDHNTLGKVKPEGVSVATMHRVKGLEYDYMFVACVNNNKVPLDIIESDDPAIIREHEQRERSLLYVAITRAKKYCSVSGFGRLSRFLDEL
ncbi:MAG: DEAD/DEAH box helicase [Bdellovibrionales bacterium]|nr:DEAD/DEAH box helicase [Bdellovibrionales bacterium]